MHEDLISRPMIMFGGKGGVGKTTCSAATALQLSSAGLNTLIVTSDTTPSLSDIFEEEIGDSIRSIEKRLDAVEISNEAILIKWKKKFGPDFYEILSHLIDVEGLDSESRHQLLDYIGSAPSLKEETMLDLILDLAETGKYDRIVWDTAPAGETLNLLNMPEYIRKHLSAGSRVFKGLDKIGKKIIGKRSIAQIMDEWIAASERISRYIHMRSAFILVASPEALVVKQARRVVEILRGYHITLHGMIINRVIKNPDSQSLMTLQTAQETYLADLINLANGLPVAMLPFSIKEIKGKKALKEAGEGLIEKLKLQE
ncbi:MAG: ArsA family ATPase [Nitrospirae bacterium]|nr:ArsA family ATPase [Nitrospirota bacterium]